RASDRRPRARGRGIIHGHRAFPETPPKTLSIPRDPGILPMAVQFVMVVCCFGALVRGALMRGGLPAGRAVAGAEVGTPAGAALVGADLLDVSVAHQLI